jgi:hypothetical protein
MQVALTAIALYPAESRDPEVLDIERELWRVRQDMNKNGAGNAQGVSAGASSRAIVFVCVCVCVCVFVYTHTHVRIYIIYRWVQGRVRAPMGRILALRGTRQRLMPRPRWRRKGVRSTVVV